MAEFYRTNTGVRAFRVPTKPLLANLVVLGYDEAALAIFGAFLPDNQSASNTHLIYAAAYKPQTIRFEAYGTIGTNYRG